MTCNHRFFLLFALVVAAMAMAPARGDAADFAAPQMSVAAFRQTEGVNTHLSYNDGAYANVAKVVESLKYLGIDHVRDGVTSTWQFDAYKAVARAGMKFVAIVVGGGDLSYAENGPKSPSLSQRVTYVDDLAQTAPGSVVAVEGPNEINNFPVVYNGRGKSRSGGEELDAALALQSDLYRTVHEDFVLHGVPVVYFTGWAAGSIPLGPDPMTTPDLADFNNQHPYPKRGEPPGRWVSREEAFPNQRNNAVRQPPAMYTETGYTTKPGVADVVTPEMQAKYTLDLLFDAAKNGIAGTYLYELLDAYAPNSPHDDGYGLFDFRFHPKPVAVAIHNLNAILGDAGNAASPRPGLRYAVTGAAPTVNSLALSMPNGATVVILWDERSGKLGQAPSPSPATLAFQGAAAAAGYTVLRYDPLKGSSPTATLTNVRQLPVPALDDPVLLVVKSP